MNPVCKKPGCTVRPRGKNKGKLCSVHQKEQDQTSYNSALSGLKDLPEIVETVERRQLPKPYEGGIDLCREMATDPELLADWAPDLNEGEVGQWLKIEMFEDLSPDELQTVFDDLDEYGQLTQVEKGFKGILGEKTFGYNRESRKSIIKSDLDLKEKTHPLPSRMGGDSDDANIFLYTTDFSGSVEIKHVEGTNDLFWLNHRKSID